MTDNTDTNPRAVPGDNKPPDWAAITISDINERFAADLKQVEALIEEGRTLPIKIENDEQAGIASALVVRMRKHADALDSHREAEKGPHETKVRSINGIFFGAIERLRRRNKGDKPGVADILYGRVHVYNEDKLVREQQRRRQDALDARKEADQLQAEAEVAEAARVEAERVAARARAPVHIETKTAAAEVLTEKAVDAKVEAMLANDTAETAERHAKAKPADMVRTRHEEGTTNTMGTEAYAEVIVDEDGTTHHDELDKEKLWPFISDDVKEKALRAWAKTTGHKQKMAGANIGRRNKTQIRG